MHIIVRARYQKVKEFQLQTGQEAEPQARQRGGHFLANSWHLVYSQL